jgi:phage repressor protein C with HTH and peptisase S24 domain
LPHVDLKASAGFGALSDEINMTQDFIAFAKSWILANIHAPLDNLVLFTVSGDSMTSPTSQIKDGSLIMVDKSVDEFKNDGVYVVSIEDALFVKRLQILPGRQLKVKSDNPAYDPFIISMESDNFHIVGKVIWAGSLLEGLK